jgi:hypothetical protein
MLLSIRLRFASRPGRSLTEIMDKISDEAQRRGMTPQILEDILSEG